MWEHLEQLRLRVCPGMGEWTFYQDDGHTWEYKTGGYCTRTYRVHTEGEKTIVETGKRQGSFLPPEREMIVELVGVGEECFRDDGRERQIIF